MLFKEIIAVYSEETHEYKENTVTSNGTRNPNWTFNIH
jgi:hypothetical protein